MQAEQQEGPARVGPGGRGLAPLRRRCARKDARGRVCRGIFISFYFSAAYHPPSVGDPHLEVALAFLCARLIFHL